MGVRGFIRNLKIRYKLLLGYSGILLLIGVIGATSMYLLVRNTVEAGIQRELKNSTATILSMVRTAAQTSIRNRLRAVAETNLQVVAWYYDQYREGAIDEATAKSAAEDLLKAQTIGATGYIYCLNSKGVLVMHPKRPLLGQNISEYQFVQDQMRRREGYLEYEWQNPGETRARPKALYMIYFEPWDWIISVSSYRTEFAELINVDDFKSSILGLRFGETGYSYILDSHGNIVLHPHLEGNLYNATDSEGVSFVKRIIKNKTGRITYTWQNPGEDRYRKKLAFFNYLPEYDWVVVSTCYHEEVFAPLNTVRQIFAIISLVAFLLLILLSLAIGRSITRPIRQLMGRFATGARGDLSVRMTPASEDEIGQLAVYFNRFMARLEEEHAKRHRAERDRQQMSEQLQQSQKMEAIGQLAGGIAHDFNNILTAILGSAELLKIDAEPSKHRLIDNIIQSSSRASELTRNLLDFSRKGTLQKLPVDIHKMLDEVSILLSHSIDKRIDIQSRFESENPVVVGDPSKLQNAFLNLALNARDAMPGGGTITFETTDIEYAEPTRTRFGELPSGRYVKIAVRDTGVGIPEADLKRVLEPFYTTKKQGEGTGLGLASVYGSVLIHDGQVDIDSAVGEGTVFDIYLPLPDMLIETEEDDNATGLILGTGIVMIVDDEEIVRDYAVGAFKKFGYDTVDFGDPRTAVDYFATHHDDINLVLLDLMMPKMNGRETLERLLRIDPDIPVIIASGYGEQQEGDLLKEGARYFLRKPFKMQELSRLADRFAR